MPASKKITVRAKLAELTKAHKGAEQPSTPMVGAGSLVAMMNGEMREVVTVRTYFNPKGSGMQPVRACIWIIPADDSAWRTGRGSASGCGYHKESAAIADAVSDAGIELYGDPYSYRDKKIDFKKRVYFGGTGASAYAEIFKAIARAAGHKGRMVWVSHGL